MDAIKEIESKILNLEDFLEKQRVKSRKIVFTNGCFDILHKGHIVMLSKASEYGDILVVGLNSDESVKRLKGDDRPLQDESSRSLIMASLQFVDYVIIFHEDTPQNIIDSILPDVLVKGGDYKPEEIVGYSKVKSTGGEVYCLDFVEGYSSTSIIKKKI